MESDGIQIPSHCNWPIFPRGTEPSREGRIFPVVLCLSEDKVCLASGMVCRMSQVSDLVVRRLVLSRQKSTAMGTSAFGSAGLERGNRTGSSVTGHEQVTLAWARDAG